MPTPTPQSSVEQYLSVIAGHGGEIPSEPASRVEYYLNEIVEQGGIGGKLRPEIVSALPQTGVTGLLYLVPVQSSSGQNTHNEYIWIEEESKFELLGQTQIEVDLTGLVPDTRKVGNVPLSADIPVSVTGDTAITVTNTGTASAIGYGITLKDSGVTAGSKGDTTNQTPGFGDTFKVLSATVDVKGRVTSLAEHTVKTPDKEATQSVKGLMSAADKTKLNKHIPKGSAVRGIYIDASDNTQAMAHELNADVPSGFAPASAAALMDGTAAVGTSAKYAREDHKHPTDTSRASAADLAALVDYIKSMEVYRTASGNPATFADGAAVNLKNVSVTITPTQSGSGDPYPPGGGKNLIPFTPNGYDTDAGVTLTLNKDSAGNVQSVSINGTATNTGYLFLGRFTVPPGTYTMSGWPATSEDCGRLYNDGGTVSGGFSIYNGRPVHTVTVSAETLLSIYFQTLNGYTYNNFILKPMVCAGTDTQFAPYSNIRPITGISSVSVTRTGKNLCPITGASTTTNGVTFTVNQNGTITANGTASALSLYMVAHYANHFGYGEFVLSGCPAGGGPNTYRMAAYETGGAAIGYDNGDSVNFQGSSNNAIRIIIASGVTVNNLVFRPMVRRVTDTDPTFEPYQGQTVTVQLTDGSDPLTVYGGTLNITTGELTVTYRTLTLNSSYISSAMPYKAGFPGAWLNGSDNGMMTYPAYNPNNTEWNTEFSLCDMIPVEANPYSRSVRAVCIRYATGLCVRLAASDIPNFSDTSDESAIMAAVKRFLDDKTPALVYRLATPLTYQLTPQQLAALSGYNSVTTDAESVSLTYKADTAPTFGG